MRKTFYIEQQLLERMLAAGTEEALSQIFQEIRELKLQRYHAQLRAEVLRLGKLSGLHRTAFVEDTADHIEQQRVLARRRAVELARRVIGNCGVAGIDVDAIRALLGAASSKRKKPAEDKVGRDRTEELPSGGFMSSSGRLDGWRN